jgi:hypothetical protein
MSEFQFGALKMKSKEQIIREKTAVAGIWNKRKEEEREIDPIASAIHNTLCWVLGQRVFTYPPSEVLTKLVERVRSK